MRQNLSLPAGLDGCVWDYQFRGQAYPMHRHDELECNLVVAGRARILLGDRQYETGRHALVWLFPGQEHVLLDQSPDFAMWVAVFRPRLVRRAVRTIDAAVLRRQNPAGHFCRALDPAAARSLATTARALAGREDARRLCNAGIAYLLLAAWEAYRTAPEIPAGPELHPAVERAAHRLRAAPEDARLPALADRVGLSLSRLSRVFHAQTGVTLVEFRNRRRIERYLKCYGEGQRGTRLAAALDAGFGSYAQFHRIFRRTMGCTPRAYRADGPD